MQGCTNSWSIGNRSGRHFQCIEGLMNKFKTAYNKQEPSSFLSSLWKNPHRKEDLIFTLSLQRCSLGLEMYKSSYQNMVSFFKAIQNCFSDLINNVTQEHMTTLIKNSTRHISESEWRWSLDPRDWDLGLQIIALKLVFLLLISGTNFRPSTYTHVYKLSTYYLFAIT